MADQAAHRGPVVRTKLHRQPVPQDLVPRPRLQDALESFRSRPLTLVSAAAGYGKSTLVSAWLAGLDGPSAWLSLDESDDSPFEFLRYFVAAVQSAFPTALPETMALLEAVTMPPPSIVAGTVLNELDDLDEPLVLVLDDIHHLKNRAVTDLLAELLTHPPAGLHLVLLGRHDPFLPIASLRAKGLMGELRSEDLIFTPAETGAFLRNVLGTAVTADAATAWADGSEGWVTGLRLAALALGPGVNVLEDPFTRWKGRQHTLQYLLQEGVEPQAPSAVHHLLRSSVTNRFCASICDTLREAAGDADANGMDGKEFLHWLQDTGLFVIPLDREHLWFRYHHLFRDMLREEAARRYGAEQVAALQLKVSEWFEGQGQVDEALDLALAAGDVERAAHLVEHHSQDAFDSDRWYDLGKRLARLPDMLVERSPALLIARAWVVYYRGENDELSNVLDAVGPLLGDDPGHRSMHGEMAFFRGVFCFYNGEGARSLALFEKALAAILVSHTVRRGEVYAHVGVATQLVMGSDHAKQMLDDLLASDTPLDERSRAALQGTRAMVSLISGDLEETAAFAGLLEGSALECRSAFLMAWSHYLQGNLHLLRCELDEAVVYLTRATDQRFVFDGRAAVDAYAGLMVALQTLGRRDEAQAALHRLREFAATFASQEFSAVADSAEARLAILQGRPESAAVRMQGPGPPGTEVMPVWLEIPRITRCWALIAEGSTANLSSGLDCLRPLEERNEADHNAIQLIRILALQAVAYGKLGEPVDARAALERALALAGPGGVLLPFLELDQPMTDLLRQLLEEGTSHASFVKQLLSARYRHDGRTPPAEADSLAVGSAKGTPDTLTSREVEVLELLTDGLYQKEIAEQLFVSAETVKTHLKHIYRKLGVRNRMGAVESARVQGLTTSK